MPQPTPSQGHYDLLLSNLSVAYIQQQQNYIAPQLFRPFPVDYQNGIYMRFPKGYFYRDEVQRRELFGEPPMAGFEIDSLPYHCDEWTIATGLDSTERANATPPYDPERSKIEWLSQQQLIHQDRLWASAYFGTGIWSTDITGVTSSPSSSQIVQWDQSASTPLDDIEHLKIKMALATGFEPNTLVLGRGAFRALKTNPSLVQRWQYTNPDAITTDMLARMFELDRVLVTRSVYNTAVEKAPGTTGLGVTSTTDNVSMSFLADATSAWIGYVDPNPGLMTPTAGLTFVWSRLPGAGTSTAPIMRSTDSYGGAFFEKFASRMGYGFGVVAPDLGTFISGAVGSALAS
jgi:hypothetical protein